MRISIEKENAMKARMERLGIRESDLQESFVRSSGPGGQKVNKTSSCVLLVHLPTGIKIKAQESVRRRSTGFWPGAFLSRDRILREGR